jgi:cell division protein FtsI/penicillin-binding protein 2
MGVKQKFPTISVNNYAIPQGNNIRLDDGDIVYFYDDDGGFKEYLLFKEKSSAGLMSTIRNVNGSLERIYFSKYFTMARHFGDGLQAVIANTCEEEKDKDFDVTWTIDRKLHSAIQDKLEKFLKLGVNNRAKLQIDPAAVTLIDNDTGDILTLASFPDASVLESSTSELQRKGKGQAYIDRLTLNQNLLNHPIGSAGKPFLATAIWSVHPYLSEFSIIKHPPGNEIKNTLGLSLDKPFEIFSHRENVIDRRAFLHYSCNLYMVNLFLLGLASDSTEDQKFGYTFESIPLEYEVGGVGISNGIDFSQYLKQPSNMFVNLEKSPIARALNSIFDIEIQVVDSNDIRENTAARYDTQLLEPISNVLFIHDKFQLKPLFSCCPEQVNLRFNQIQLLRSEFISLDLGGASSEWNNIKLSESVARVVTGKKVKARLIKDISGKNVVLSEAKSQPSFPLFEQEVETALQWVREGMQLVTTDGGTAQALAPHIKKINDRLMEQDLRIGFYSKTGSPRKKDVGPNSAVYIFSVILEKKNGDFWASMNGISGSIYIESRGLSALAVTFAGRILDDIVNYLYSQYELNL